MAQKRRKRLKFAVNAKAKARDPRQLQIPDSVIDQILEAMKIPEAIWSDAAWKVFSAVESCVESFADGRLGTDKKGYRTIASTCRQLLRALSNLNAAERRHLSANLQDFEKNLDGIGSTALSLTATWRPRHRPRGSVKYPHIRDLIYELDILAGVHGAELTFYLDMGKKKGSLQAILDILHGLSPEIFPADMAFNTLKEMRRWAKERLDDEGQLYLSHLDEDHRSA
jgi:hypothetical protein